MGLGQGRKTEIRIVVPLRVSLLGGGTDMPSFIKDSVGTVLSCGIQKYLEMQVLSHLPLQTLKSAWKDFFMDPTL
jgi:galactokinase/mevalonate kinase-like predicted kinase